MSFNAFSQNYPVINFNNLLNSPEKYSNEIDRRAIEEIEGLIYDLNPTVFIDDSGSKAFGEGAPVKAEVNAGNVQELFKSNSNFIQVKLLTLKIEKPGDLNISLDLNSFSEFQNLNYILVQCAFKCNQTRIKNIFSNVGNVVILYIVATPE